MNFPKHKCGLHLTHNQHRDYYQTLPQYLSDEHAQPSFKDASARQRAIDTGEIWELQWYPETPIGFHLVAAPTLDEVLAYALEVERENGTTDTTSVTEGKVKE